MVIGGNINESGESRGMYIHCVFAIINNMCPLMEITRHNSNLIVSLVCKKPDQWCRRFFRRFLKVHQNSNK